MIEPSESQERTLKGSIIRMHARGRSQSEAFDADLFAFISDELSSKSKA